MFIKISKDDVKTIGRNIALVFFKAIHEYNIIFGDMNPGNFVTTKKQQNNIYRLRMCI